MANGLVSCGSGVGTMVMGPVMQVLIEKVGWVNTIRVCSALMILVTLASLVYRPRIPPIPAEIAKTRPLFDVSVFKNKAYVLFVIALSFFMLAYFVPFVHLVSFVHLVTMFYCCVVIIMLLMTTVTCRIHWQLVLGVYGVKN